MEHITQEEKDSMMDNLFDIKVKGKVDVIWRLQKQLERCNMILGMGNFEAFENSVLALKGDLPMGVKEAVLDRQGEFNSTPVRYQYTNCCGVKVGTIKNPMVDVPGHPEWEFLLDVPKPYRESHVDEIDILSPIKVEETETDYIDLYEIIKEELEKAGTSWQYEKKIPKAMKIQETLPKKIINEIVKNRVDLLMSLRQDYPEMVLGYRDLNVGWHETPQTPVFERGEDE